MAPTMSFLDLPLDIIHLITPYLDDPLDFFHLTATCKSLRQPELLQDAQYWSQLTRWTFRVPNQPVISHDGTRWMQLYRRMRTQSKVYTWGSNDKGCLGHSYWDHFWATTATNHNTFDRTRHHHISWPGEMEFGDAASKIGVVSDVQCGGWSTTLLTSKGALFTVGVLDGLIQRGPSRMQKLKMSPEALRYPPGYPNHGTVSERYDPATAVRQFSAGRSHVLALSDSGRIWSWQDIEHDALHVKFLRHDTVETGRERGRNVVTKVVAGFTKSAALIEGVGIVVWEPLRREQDESAIEDAALVLESAVVPDTSFVHMRGSTATRDSSQNGGRSETVGEVKSFLVLEQVIMFNTHLGKIFAAPIIWTREEQRVGQPVELGISKNAGTDESFATDLQGFFRSFAIFTRSGEVLTGHQDAVNTLFQERQPSNQYDPPTCIKLWKIPALQHRDVIQVAFGDYHFHALHAQGHITSYGYEPESCGALGLGGRDPEGRLRGIRYAGVRGDARLVPHAYTEGRRVWFEKGKRHWIRFLTSGGVDAGEAAARLRMAIGSPDVTAQGEVSEWIEQEGRDWQSKYLVSKLPQDQTSTGDQSKSKSEDKTTQLNDDGLPAYFALSVTAAGWHSGALVLVNESLAQKLQQAIEVPDEERLAAMKLEEEATSDSDPAGHREHPAANAQFGDFRRPNNNDVSPRDGYKYVWAQDSFPRLRMSNGTEMPGEGEFDEWRYGRPEWVLDEDRIGTRT